MGPELDLRPQLERLDRLICWSEGIDEGALSFAFRPLWQLDEPAKAALALSRAQATQVYAGLKLWPEAAMARLAGPLPVPNTPADPSAAGQGPYTPVELASSRGRARALARMLGALAAAARSIRRWLPEDPDEPEPTSGPDVTLQAPSTPPQQSSPPIVQPPKLTIQDLARVTRGFAGRESAQKWLSQMDDRGWTPEQIEEAIQSGAVS